MREQIGHLFACALLGLGLAYGSSCLAQTAPAPASPAPAVQAAPATPPAASPSPAPTTPQPAPDGDASSAQSIDVPARPAVMVRGAANWDDGYKAITSAIAKARAGVAKGNLKETGRPIASFVDTDDNGFKFEAMIPIEAAPAGTVDLGADAKVGVTPAGKAIKFQHRGAYDDIDSTYEAITAYLDEKGYDAQTVFVEEYLNDPKGADDTALALDIYVFIK